MESPPTNEPERSGPNRRDVLRRGAILGGAMVWTVPAVQTFGGAAFAATGTPPCTPPQIQVNAFPGGPCIGQITLAATATCCDCIASYTNPGIGALTCWFFGSCTGPIVDCP